MRGARSDRHWARQRGSVVVLAAISMVVVIGIAALAIDLGQLYVVRAELQRAADAAALAGASSYFSDAGLAQDIPELSYLIDTRSQEVSLANLTRHAGTVLDLADIVIGAYDHDYPEADLDVSGSLRFNAVQVTARRTSDSPNGPVTMFFAGIFGVDESGVVAQATAVADDRFAGLRLERGFGYPFIPFTIDIDLYNDMVVNGHDGFSYDDGVYGTGDGIPEVRLYPWKHFGGDPSDPWDDVYTVDDSGQGNFGILEFGGGGAAATSERIRNGVSAAELEAEIGTSELRFYDDLGNPITYQMSGSPGVQAAVADALEQRIGDMVGFFIHDGVTGSGASVEYRTVAVRFGRIMDIRLKCNPSERGLSVQPTAYSGSEVIVRRYAPETDGQIGRAMLVK
ncbi:MAG: hypothetical protein KKI02_06495 [Planctomycetes bacterium]|nr:hypothetical protein [Planctomycetota bacterium]